MNANKKLSNQWREDEAVARFSLISPLLDDTLDEAKRIQIRFDIAEKSSLSVRTIYRYEKAYRDGGFDGLKPRVIIPGCRRTPSAIQRTLTALQPI